MTKLELPPSFRASEHHARVQVALAACVSAGAALVELRGQPVTSAEQGDQLKTSVDQAAEGWVLGMLRGTFPADRYLAEEAFELQGQWSGGEAPYWTVDALDGTRSYVEGYAGFCVQVAYVVAGTPQLGVVCEPVARRTFAAVRGAGAFCFDDRGSTRLELPARGSEWPQPTRFVDSIPPAGEVGRLMQELNASFVECGSIGLKVCRIAEGAADVFAKRFRYKLWDIAPGSVVLHEAGGHLGTWQTSAIDYLSQDIFLPTLLCTPKALWPSAQAALNQLAR